jgi:prolyl-tRNA editing enzyme YbaK/EbsC (Cys-tRNA(Pro) deacylase)
MRHVDVTLPSLQVDDFPLSNTMTPTLKPSAQRVQDALTVLGFPNRVFELDASTRTSAEAAAAVGCDIGQIAKSLVFRGAQSHKPILIIASGANRVNLQELALRVGETLERPDADFVREQTGYAIGGVPPLAHVQPLETWLDADLWRYATIWAAAGHPNALFPLSPDELATMTGGSIVPIA